MLRPLTLFNFALDVIRYAGIRIGLPKFKKLYINVSHINGGVKFLFAKN